MCVCAQIITRHHRITFYLKIQLSFINYYIYIYIYRVVYIYIVACCSVAN